MAGAADYNLHFILRTLHSTLTLHSWHSTSAIHTLHFALYTLHFTLHTLHSVLYTLHSTLYTLHSRLCTLHSRLHTLHTTFPTQHFTIFTLHILHSTPFHTPESTLVRSQEKNIQHCWNDLFDKRASWDQSVCHVIAIWCLWTTTIGRLLDMLDGGWWLLLFVAAVAGFHQSLMFQNIQSTAIGLASFAAEVCIDWSWRCLPMACNGFWHRAAPKWDCDHLRYTMNGL